MKYFLCRKLSRTQPLSESNLWLKNQGCIRYYGVMGTHGLLLNNWYTELLFWSQLLKSLSSKMNNWTYLLTVLNQPRRSKKILNHQSLINLCPRSLLQRGNSSRNWLIFQEILLSSICPTLMPLKEKKFRSLSGSKLKFI